MSAATLWTQFMTQYRCAEMAGGIMRDKAADQAARDEAVVRYSRACDRMVETLGKMQDQQLLTRIGNALNGRGF